MSSNIPKDYKYNKSHEWMKHHSGDAENVFTVGISDHAQSLLGDLVFVELPEVETDYNTGDECCVVESVKAASDVYCPVSGTVVEVNDALNDSPDQVNSSPYNDGWIFKLKVNNLEEINNLISADEYESLITEEA